MGIAIDVGSVVVAGIIGIKCQSVLTDKLKETIMIALGVGMMFMGASSALAMIDNSTSTMMIVSLALGAMIGELIDIEGRISKLGSAIKKRFGSSNDPQFVNGFVESSIAISVGAMCIIGPMNEVLYGDSSVLITKSIIDFIMILMLTFIYGKGCLFSAVSVGIVQSLVALMSVGLKHIITDNALMSISLIGGILIFCLGVNIAFNKKIRIANLLPALIIAVIYVLL